MLKNIDPLLNADLLGHLRAMGHGDVLALVDRNYPAASSAQRLVVLSGVDIIAAAGPSSRSCPSTHSSSPPSSGWVPSVTRRPCRRCTPTCSRSSMRPRAGPSRRPPSSGSTSTAGGRGLPHRRHHRGPALRVLPGHQGCHLADRCSGRRRVHLVRRGLGSRFRATRSSTAVSDGRRTPRGASPCRAPRSTDAELTTLAPCTAVHCCCGGAAAAAGGASGTRPVPAAVDRRRGTAADTAVEAGRPQRHRLRLLDRHLAARRATTASCTAREAGLLFTEDDLLWYQLKPRPTPSSTSTRATRSSGSRGSTSSSGSAPTSSGTKASARVGPTRTSGTSAKPPREAAAVRHRPQGGQATTRAEMNGWIVANEVTDPEFRNKHGFRTNVPVVPDHRPGVHPQRLRDRGRGATRRPCASSTSSASRPSTSGATSPDRAGAPSSRRSTACSTPACRSRPSGIQGHLLADRFGKRFHEKEYRAFLREFADRGLPILITEMDVLDDGLPKDRKKRDQKVADVYRRYLDVALDEKAVKVVVAFGLTDRYTWLHEDKPREDGGHRRPLAFSRTCGRSRRTGRSATPSSTLRGASSSGSSRSSARTQPGVSSVAGSPTGCPPSAEA